MTQTKNAVILFDVQNVFKTAQDQFATKTELDNRTFPHFYPITLAQKIAESVSVQIHNSDIRVYTGVPTIKKARERHLYWSNKKLALKRRGVFFWESALRYSKDERGKEVPREKGVDVRIALDIFKLGLESSHDAIIIASHDQDLVEAITEAQSALRARGKIIEIYSAFPTRDVANDSANTKWQNDFPFPIKGCIRLPISEEMYRESPDPRDFFPKSTPSPSRKASPRVKF